PSLPIDVERAPPARHRPCRVAAIRQRPRGHHRSTRMHEASLTRLKIIVERAGRPVRASTRRQRAMREELLAHLLGVFEEESARLGDDRAALERTALRFGDPTEVMGELQATVPFGDGIRRSWEGGPGESAMRAGLRIAGVIGALAMFSLGAVLLATGWD